MRHARTESSRPGGEDNVHDVVPIEPNAVLASRPGDPEAPLVTRAETTIADVVVLVDEDGTPNGTWPRRTVHSDTTPLHLAISVYLLDPAGRLLLTRRALGKRTWPGVWTNSCCGHLRPGESGEQAARRHLRTELGVTDAVLTCVLPDFRYRAQDAAGVWENEICPVFLARPVGDVELTVDPDEAMEIAWANWSAVRTAMTLAPFAFSPWSREQVAIMAVPESR